MAVEELGIGIVAEEHEVGEQAAAVLAEGVRAPTPSEAVAKIATGLKFVVTMLDKVEIPTVATAAFEQAVTSPGACAGCNAWRSASSTPPWSGVRAGEGTPGRA